ncbi:hypothetical protein BBD42_15310 [Paenibacillus sp. BIHB 4019]|uniref:HTH cro/C1-type domain-containing protein n=1 Tax=Paenibacillus sp. BIHB 4019 TaxID=1870819 RepID=A0A1B2DIW3_9BACL|nr:helix-turn-helix transcriptional regulator [Paenibacillus sp. BIHB 4019]ANY67680.1 hypothetical protein BBD42_15310 [Paenibacillus sp. BIHB 4019]
MSYEKTLASRVKLLRERHDLLQAEVAEGVKLSTSTYSNIETGYAKSTKLKTVIAFADFYGVTTDFLLGRTDKTLDKYGTLIIDPHS